MVRIFPVLLVFYGISISNGATYQRTAIDFRRGLSAIVMYTHTGLPSTSMNCSRRPWNSTGLTFCSWRLDYGVDDNVEKREGVVGFDINLEVFPVSDEDLLLAQRTINMFHIPAPAVKFTESKKPRYFLFHTN